MDCSICSICHSEIVDKVYMTCSAKHPFCFKCLLQSVEATNELKNCPNCRGGDKFIMIESDTSESTNDFYTLNYFKKSIPILQKILNDNNVTPNSCLISEYLLISYTKNKKQLEIVHKLLSQDYKIADLIPLIRWYEKRSMDDIGMEFIGSIASDFLNGFTGAPSNFPPVFERAPNFQSPPSTAERQNEPRFTVHSPSFGGAGFPFPSFRRN